MPQLAQELAAEIETSPDIDFAPIDTFEVIPSDPSSSVQKRFVHRACMDRGPIAIGKTEAIMALIVHACQRSMYHFPIVNIAHDGTVQMETAT
jgi:hypothetical protein